jgi:hypothetical protein
MGRPGVVGFMLAAVLTTAGNGQAIAQFEVCVRGDVKAGVANERCHPDGSSDSVFLMIAPDHSAARVDYFLKIDSIDGESTVPELTRSLEIRSPGSDR